MTFVKILCDDNYDSNLTQQIDGEIVADNYSGGCENCPKFKECQGWDEVFGRCERQN